ncbi:Uncharacterised protein g10529 [Pycnogonum litorale]
MIGHVTGNWINPISGVIWIATSPPSSPDSPCVFNIMESSNIISVGNLHCFRDHDDIVSSSSSEQNVGYVAVCGTKRYPDDVVVVDDDSDTIWLAIFISYKVGDKIGGKTYVFDTRNSTWFDNSSVVCEKDEECPEYSEHAPVVHCNRNTMAIIVDDLQHSWAWSANFKNWAKLPFLFADDVNSSGVRDRITSEQVIWSRERDGRRFSELWVMFGHRLFHGTMLICDECTQEFSWDSVTPDGHGPISEIGPPISSTISWSDRDGNLWLYAPSLDRNGTETNSSDFWFFDVHLSVWTKLVMASRGPDLLENGTIASARALRVPGNVSVLIVNKDTKYMAFWTLSFIIPSNVTAYRLRNGTHNSTRRTNFPTDYHITYEEGVDYDGAELKDDDPESLWQSGTDLFGPLIFFGTSVSLFLTFGLLWLLFKFVRCHRAIQIIGGGGGGGGESNDLTRYSVLDAESLPAA